MKQFKKYTILPVLIFSVSGYSQTISSSIINSGGSSIVSSGIFLESNVGEAFAAARLSDNNHIFLVDGFLQPYVGTGILPPPPTMPANAIFTGTDNAGNSVVVNNIFLENTLGEWMTTTRTGGNQMITQGILQPYLQSVGSPLPVIGLEFYAKRINKQQVQLAWKTLQEINNKGFHIERKKESDNNFTALKFINSKGQNGNSSLSLAYTQLDTNSFAGKTYYRLKQEDFDGKYVYSVIRVVNGDAEKQVSLKAWPIPAPKEFSVMVLGIEKDVLLIYDASGRLIKEQPVSDGEPTKIDGLSSGIYFLKLKAHKELVQKITVL